MKSRSRFMAIVISILVGGLIFALLYTFTKPAMPRLPSPNYSTLEEEYIDAIETFNHTGKIVIPKGAIFSYDGNTAIIKDVTSGAYVSCSFVLDGTVPIYTYNHYVSILPAFFAIFFAAIFSFGCYQGINALSNAKKFKTLDMCKHNATYGDDRRIALNCSKCYKKENCKCIQCPYLVYCGRCPTSDCEDYIEDMLQEHLKHEDVFAGENDESTSVQGRCNNCDKATSCECLDCKYIYICDECPSDNCVANFESKLEPDQEKAVEHVHEESESSFKCTPTCVNFKNCACLHGCEYAHECKSCPYPGCTYDFENKLLGITISKKSPTDEK